MSEKDSNRVRLFKVLAKFSGPGADGITAGKLKKLAKATWVRPILKGECLREKAPRVRRIEPYEGEERFGYRFVLTKAGLRALEEGTVDRDAIPVSRVYGSKSDMDWEED